ncbi:GNAT family N-acetyltransferase [Facklamia miroungae]|uniref:Phosphinothricin acetyltransferase n=1 Tax=Facklamia miroungae TaxID=120956 RepID=A0A1G7U529_9LACT|nr:GNAT family N-acetyltransferase [Facklamia miroungae]NKZ29920.1 N-acetyltransferase [Facklamia miroungae]SDG42735.1 phosphinothricin acetyltransferase [Facklamia miroungae]
MLFHQKEVIIRQAQITDAQSIQSIYRPYILNTNFNLESEVPTLEATAKKIENLSKKYPFIVAEYKDTVIGFAYLSEFYEPFLSHTGLLSIYTAENCPVKGVGHELYTVIEFLLSQTSTEYIISTIVADNHRSLRFHEKEGFETMLTFPKLAQKAGKLIDVIWMRKAIKAASPIIQYQPLQLDFERDNLITE